MRGTVLRGTRDVRIESAPDARLLESTDAVIAVSRACIRGSDLWPYNLTELLETGRPRQRHWAQLATRLRLQNVSRTGGDSEGQRILRRIEPWQRKSRATALFY